jgi:hypothetical protein
MCDSQEDYGFQSPLNALPVWANNNKPAVLLDEDEDEDDEDVHDLDTEEEEAAHKQQRLPILAPSLLVILITCSVAGVYALYRRQYTHSTAAQAPSALPRYGSV